MFAYCGNNPVMNIDSAGTRYHAVKSWGDKHLKYIYVNSSEGTTATGLETHYYHDYSVGLAKTVHTAMTKGVKSNDRGLFKSKFYVINHTTMPAILLEIGFISNDEEREDLVSVKRKKATAKAIAEGIMNYYKQQQKEK